jgi:tetrahydromethanopterin S-methyltransferase subunit G
VAAWAVQWGWMKAQINQMSKRLDEHNDVKERLARIEEKLNYIIKQA